MAVGLVLGEGTLVQHGRGRGCLRRVHGEPGAPASSLRARCLRHVTTSGAVRPVCAAIPAIASAAAIRSASMAGVSSASLPSGAS